MTIEERLAEALREEADAREVDVTPLWGETRARLAAKRRGSSWPRWGFAAAVAGVVVAGAVGVARIDGPSDVGPAGRDDGSRVPVGVENEFSCPEQITHDWTRPESVTDDYFVASLQGGAEHQAAAHGAARYEFEEVGDRAFLRFGNADATLATLSEFRRDGDGRWVRHRTDVCVGENGSIAVPTGNDLDLGRHEKHSDEIEQLVFGDRDAATMLIDNRAYYDHVGLVRHRSLYAVGCGRGICLASGNGEESSGVRLSPGVVPQDVSHLFLPSDEMPGRKNPYGLWALYDVDGVAGGVVTHTRRGGNIAAQSFYVDGWKGQLRLLLAPFDQVEKITVLGRPGAPGSRPREYTPDELPSLGPGPVHR